MGFPKREALLAVGAPAVVALFINAPRVLLDRGFFGNDFDIHYRWAVEFTQRFHNHDPYPRWMYFANHGLGEPALLYYAPLYYYLTALIRSFTSTVWESMKIVELLASWTTGISSYFTCRLFVKPAWSVLGAVTMQTAPIIFMVLNYLNGIPWAISFPAVVVVIYFSVRAVRHDELVSVPLAVSVAALVLCHILSAFILLITLPFLFVMYTWPLSRSGLQVRPMIRWAVSVAAGLGLAMVYLLPALTSMELVTPDVFVTKWLSLNAFSFPLISAHSFGVRWAIFQWPTPLLILGSAVVSTAYLWRKREGCDETWHVLLGLTAVAWAGLFLSSELSYPLWVIPTPLQMVQFPYRFHYVSSATALLANVIVLGCVEEEKMPLAKRLLTAAPLILSLVLSTVLVAKLAFIDSEPAQIVVDKLWGYGGLPEYFTPEKGPEDRAYAVRGGLAGECARAHLKCVELGIEGRMRTWQVEGATAAHLRLPAYAFPAWRVLVDGITVATWTDPRTGLIELGIPPGRHTIALIWAGLPAERVGLWGSAIVLIVLATVVTRRMIAAGSQRKFVGMDLPRRTCQTSGVADGTPQPPSTLYRQRYP